MNIASTIKHRSDNLLFQMMLAKQHATGSPANWCNLIDPERGGVAYIFEDESSLMFITTDTGCASIIAKGAPTHVR